MASFVLHLRVTDASAFMMAEQMVVIVGTGAGRPSVTSICFRRDGGETARGCAVVVAVEAVLLEGLRGQDKA